MQAQKIIKRTGRLNHRNSGQGQGYKQHKRTHKDWSRHRA